MGLYIDTWRHQTVTQCICSRDSTSNTAACSCSGALRTLTLIHINAEARLERFEVTPGSARDDALALPLLRQPSLRTGLPADPRTACSSVIRLSLSARCESVRPSAADRLRSLIKAPPTAPARSLHPAGLHPVPLQPQAISQNHPSEIKLWRGVDVYSRRGL